MILFWFRRDLRLSHNTALHEAMRSGQQILPVFIFDTDILSELPADDARVTCIHQSVESINEQLKDRGSSLAAFHGKPKEIFEYIICNEKITAVYANDDYEPYAINRDSEIAELLHQHQIGFKRYKDHVIYEKSEILKNDGSPYVVFTPYSKKWLEKYHSERPKSLNSEDADFVKHRYPFLSLPEIGFRSSAIKVPAFITPADYKLTRDYPSISTTRLGPHLRFGTVSIREVAENALQNDAALLRELIWRDFFIQILWHFPHTATLSFKKEYDKIPWRQNEADFKRWCDGTTGYPIVDAGMRELNSTGFMHNRVRMIVAGFLCKHLLIDWRRGEAYFASKLIDYELASNVGNWQWAAGSGVDAAPYFRIFNPITQALKFDRHSEYIRKWVPELGTDEYPQPMIEHKEARERALQVYANALRR